MDSRAMSSNSFFSGRASLSLSREPAGSPSTLCLLIVRRKSARRKSDSEAVPCVLAGGSSEPGCSRDQKQPCADDDGPGGSRDPLTCRCKTFDGDGCRDDSHRAKVHDSDHQEDRHQTHTALTAVEAEVQAVSPGGAGAGGQRTAGPGCLRAV